MAHLSGSSKIVNVFLSVIFILFAMVQLNDPDPYVWFTIYILVAIALIASIFVRLPMWAIYIAFAGMVLYAGFHASYFLEWLYSDNPGELFGEMSEERYYLEGTREFLGLLIALAAVVYLAIQNRNKK